MIKTKTITVILLGIIICPWAVMAQSVTVKPNDTKHAFEGGGGTLHNGFVIDNYLPSSPGRQLASDELLFDPENINMAHVQNYNKAVPADDPEYFDIRAQYFKNAKAQNPDVKVTICTCTWPDYLATEASQGANSPNLDYTRNGIYDEVADFFFDILQAYEDRDVKVDILNMFNEPDFNKQAKWGHGGARTGTAVLLQEAIPRLRSMINNPQINTDGIEMPKIMAPSTLNSAQGLSFIRFYRDNYPQAWENVDIVGIHQYGAGLDEANMLSIKNMLDGRQFYQSEQTGSHSNYLGLPSSLDRSIQTGVNLSALMANAINNGVEAWYYFVLFDPKPLEGPESGASSIVQMTLENEPTPFKQYYTFQQITSTQPKNSNVVSFFADGMRNREAIPFRYGNENIVYLNLFNHSGEVSSVDIKIEGAVIDAIQGWTTNETLNTAEVLNKTFDSPVEVEAFEMTRYSTNVFKISYTPLENVALNKTATASSTYNQTYTADNVVDGDESSNGSRWLSAAGASFPQWVEIDLGQSQTISQVAFSTGYNGYNQAISDFAFQGWNGSSWVNLVSENNNTLASYNASFNSFTTDRVRLLVNESPGNIVRLYELKVYNGEAQANITDDFETGNAAGGTGWASNWSLSSNAGVSDRGAVFGDYNLRMIENGSATRTLDLSAGSNWSIDFEIKGYSFEEGEYGIVELFDGANWNELYRISRNLSNGVYRSQSIDLSSYNFSGSSQQLRVRLEANNARDYFYIDNIVISRGGSQSGNSRQLADAADLIGENSLLTVSPNPAQNTISVSGLADGQTVEIFNLNGSKVLNANESIIDVSALPKGMYIIKAIGQAPTKLIKE